MPYQQLHPVLSGPGSGSGTGPGCGSGTGPGTGPGSGTGPASSGQDGLAVQTMQHQLVQWVWRYFSGQHPDTRGASGQHAAGGGQAVPQAAPGPASSSACPDTAGCSSLDSAGCSAGNGSVGATAGCSGRGPPPPLLPPGLGLRSSPVVLTGLPPLYFQHEGHSRTIIGIERRSTGGVGGGGARGGGGGASGAAAAAEVYTLLVLDPGTPADVLEEALRWEGGGGSACVGGKGRTYVYEGMGEGSRGVYVGAGEGSRGGACMHVCFCLWRVRHVCVGG